MGPSASELLDASKRKANCPNFPALVTLNLARGGSFVTVSVTDNPAMTFGMPKASLSTNFTPPILNACGEPGLSRSSKPTFARRVLADIVKEDDGASKTQTTTIF